MEAKENKTKRIKASSKIAIISRKLGVISFFDIIIGVGFILFLLKSQFHSPNAIIMSLVQWLIVLLAIISLCGIPAVALGIIGLIRSKKWNYIDKQNAKIGAIAGVFSITVLLITVFFLDRARKSSWLTSCANHRSFLRYELANNVPGNDLSNIYKMPYNPNLPGYAVFAKYTNHGSMGPYTACNHGAPHNWFGGWQALNLPQTKLKMLCDEWSREIKKLPEKEKPRDFEMPYAWCGKPTGFDTRISLNISYQIINGNLTWGLWKGSTNKKVIKLLNKCLKQIGEKQISLNIPDNIDWNKYLNKKSNEKDVLNPPSSGK